MARKQKITLVLLAVIGLGMAYLVLHVRPQQNYLVKLDFRRLGAIAERIDMQLGTYRQVVANARRGSCELPPPLERYEAPAECSPAIEPSVSIEAEVTARGGWIHFNAKGLKARLRIEELFQQAFEPHTFDKLILATGTGEILHQQGRSDIQLTTLADVFPEKDFHLLSRSNRLLGSEVSDRRYTVFLRPCSIPGAIRQEGAPQGWVLCALMSSPRFQLRSLEVSANWIILLVGLTVLLLLALPFVKLLTLGKKSRLKAIDGLLAGLCALMGLSVLTVLLLDRFIYRKLEKEADAQTEKLAREIHDSFLDDLDNALTAFSELRSNPDDPKAAEALKRHTNFFWADEHGQQIHKWFPPGGRETPYIDVGERTYFRDALAGQLRTYVTSGKTHHFTLESIRSWTTGEDEVEIAAPHEPLPGGKQKRYAVAALTARMGSVQEAILPRSFGFAVIDPSGFVLFHSDRKRIHQEDFLEEADSRHLEALVEAGRAGQDEILYLGRRHRLFLQPIKELSWSVIVFRDMTLLRATNVQIATTALACLLAYAVLFLVLFSLVYLASSTRARWLWPASPRQGSYLQLALFYVGCMLVHGVLLQQGNSLFLLINGALVPLMALFVSYFKIRFDERQRDRERRGAKILLAGDEATFDSKQKTALAMALALAAISLGVGWLQLEQRESDMQYLAPGAIVLGGLLLFLPAVTRSCRRWRLIPLRWCYLLCSTLLLMVLTILPAASFFKLACDVPVENLLKLGQISLMRQVRQMGPPETFNAYAGAFFDTKLAGPELPVGPMRNPHRAELLRQQERIFPIYNENSRDLARLSLDTAPEWPRQWSHQRGKLWLCEDRPGKPRLCLASVFPDVRPRKHAETSERPDGSPRQESWTWDWTYLGATFLALSLVSLGLVRLMVNRLMLLGIGSPPWLDRRRIYLGSSGSHQIYVSLRPDRLRLPTHPDVTVIDFAVRENEVEDGSLREHCVTLRKRLIAVRGFEHRLAEQSFNWAKLRVLEVLVREGARRVVLLTSSDPHLDLASGALCGGGEDPEREQEELERWRQILRRFTVVDLDGRPGDSSGFLSKLGRVKDRLLAWGRGPWVERIPWRRHVARCLRTVREECSPTARLQHIGQELLPDLHLGEASPRDIRKEILNRAEEYYAVLWSSLSDDEQLVLLQLAEEGLVNPASARSLQKLVARGLVCRDPAPRLMNETFRQFVTGTAAGEEIRQVEVQHERESLWAHLRVPLATILLGALLFVASTQQEALKTTLSLVTAVTAGLPHLLQLVGFLGTTKGAAPPGR